MQGEPTLESILVADCGSTTTRVYLFDMVAGEYRFLAKGEAATTIESPFADITLGIRNALQEITRTTGREFAIDGRLIMPQNELGDGVDLFLLTSSAGPPLTVAVADTNAEGVEALSSIVRSTFATSGLSLSPDETLKTIDSEWNEAQVEKLHKLGPDMILIAGGTDGEPDDRLTELLRVVAASLPEVTDTNDSHRYIIFAGNERARDEANKLLDNRAKFKIGANIPPEKGVLNSSYVRSQLIAAYKERMIETLPGIAALGMGQDNILSTTFESVEHAIRFLSKHYQRDVLGIDAGGSSTVTTVTSGEKFNTSISTGIGMSYGMSNLLATVGPTRILRWLPFDCEEEEIVNWALNKTLRPFIIPMTVREQAIEQAFAREAIALSFRSLVRGMPTPPIDMIVSTGGVLAHAGNIGQTALMMLDSILPLADATGSVELVLSETELLAPVGAMAEMLPDGAAEVFDRDALIWLGPVIVPVGQGAEGETAVKITVESADGEWNQLEVAYGSLAVIPLKADQRANITVEPTGQFRIGQAAPGEAVRTNKGEEIRGGQVGLIIDARGRPLAIPEEKEKRINKMREWWTTIGAM